MSGCEKKRSRSMAVSSTPSLRARVEMAKLSVTVPTLGATVGGSVTNSLLSSVRGGAQKVAHSKSSIGSISNCGIIQEPFSVIGVFWVRKSRVESGADTVQSARR